MHIDNGWEIEDQASGLRIRVIEGEAQDRLHIEFLPNPPLVRNRDFWFTRDGKFDGTGSTLCET